MSELNAIGDADVIAEVTAWAESIRADRREGRSSAPVRPPFPETWGAPHIEVLNANGLCQMRPAPPWDRCPYCWSERGGGRNTECGVSMAGESIVCPCAALRRTCEAYTRADVPVLTRTVGASLRDYRWQSAAIQEQVMSWARMNQGSVPRGPTDRSRPLMLLCGTTGTGKSHLAAGLIRRAAMICPASKPLWSTWRDAKDLAALRSPGHGADELTLQRFGRLVALKERAEKSAMLVIDEWAGDAGDFGRQVLEQVCELRGNQQRPTVITSNLGPVETRRLAGDRAWSRIMGMGVIVALVGADARRSV